MVKIAIYEDDPDPLSLFEIVSNYFKNMDEEKYSISYFNNLKKLKLSPKKFTIYIIQVTSKNYSEEIQTGFYVQKFNPIGKVIYVSRTSEYESKVCNISTVAYVAEPGIETKLNFCLNKIIKNTKPKQFLVPTARGEDTVIVKSDIIYIDIEKRNLCFHLKDGSKVTSIAIRKSFQEEISTILPKHDLLFATPTLLINIYYIDKICKDKIVFKNNEELYLSERGLKTIKETIQQQ